MQGMRGKPTHDAQLGACRLLIAPAPAWGIVARQQAVRGAKHSGMPRRTPHWPHQRVRMGARMHATAPHHTCMRRHQARPSSQPAAALWRQARAPRAPQRALQVQGRGCTACTRMRRKQSGLPHADGASLGMGRCGVAADSACAAPITPAHPACPVAHRTDAPTSKCTCMGAQACNSAASHLNAAKPKPGPASRTI